MLRRIVQVVGILEGIVLLAVVLLAIASESDPAGDAMAAGFGTLAALAIAIFVLPALLAVRKNRYLRLALGLVLVPVVLVLLGIAATAFA
jgi:hypothetical protein